MHQYLILMAGLFSPFFTFLRAIFSRPIRLSLAPPPYLPLGLRGCLMAWVENVNVTKSAFLSAVQNMSHFSMYVFKQSFISCQLCQYLGQYLVIACCISSRFLAFFSCPDPQSICQLMHMYMCTGGSDCIISRDVSNAIGLPFTHKESLGRDTSVAAERFKDKDKRPVLWPQFISFCT